MISFLNLFIPLLFLLISCFNLIEPNSSSSSMLQPLCHDDERAALLQFNQSFSTDYPYASVDPSAYRKTASWTIKDGCCSWDGVQCDDVTGYVTGLDLSSSFLYGSINSSSSLFRLLHLQNLNLADNHFNFSQIPSRFANLSDLTYLNLSKSLFSGEIPTKISQLSKLASLDLSGYSLLIPKNSGLKSLVQNLTHLKELHLSGVNISSIVPDVLANMSSLISLFLSDCRLVGEFPTRIFQLPNLRNLSVSYNMYMTGYLPEFNKTSPLTRLLVAFTGFSGELPDSIGNLNSLNELSISFSNFSGFVPNSLGNLTQLITLDLSHNNFSGPVPNSLGNLTQLITLDLSSNTFNNFNSRTLAAWLGKLNKLTSLTLMDTNLTGGIPSSIGNMTQLAVLDLHFNFLTGGIPSSIGNMTQLVVLDLQYNHLTGQLPSLLENLTQLIDISLSSNEFTGPIPRSINRLTNLQLLDLAFNNLSGTVEMDMFLDLKNLNRLLLSANSLSVHINTSRTTHLPQLRVLGLGSCNLTKFPGFLRHQHELMWLDLSENRIQGDIPKWMWNVSKESIIVMSFDNNCLTGFDQPPPVLPWTSLSYLNLGSNMLRGSLPLPPPSIFYFLVSNNSLAGEISPSICNLTSLLKLDLSNNNLSGTLPECLGNLSNSLNFMNLRKNNFHGTIPQTFTNQCKLTMIDVTQNRLRGRLPRSLANCKMLQSLFLGVNQFNDTFPYWLGSLPSLRVLIMRSNEFHGAIRSPEVNLVFPKLRVIDLSNNSFTGKLPSEYLKIWNAMKAGDVKPFTYLQDDLALRFVETKDYWYSMTITKAGIETPYERIPDNLRVIDLSSNIFQGDVPKSIGNLDGLQMLNLSHNILTGRIPSCLGNLKELYSLDLSHNKLSGEIPQQLTGLPFLANLDVSHNFLTGKIPQGTQFSTFNNNSFEGNSGLCGNPLSKKCENSDQVPPSTTSEQEEDKDSKFPSGYDWMFIALGYGSGLIVGLVIGHTITTKKHDRFVQIFRRVLQRNKRPKKRGRGRPTGT